jgi:hypothetical protein
MRWPCIVSQHRVEQQQLSVCRYVRLRYPYLTYQKPVLTYPVATLAFLAPRPPCLKRGAQRAAEMSTMRVTMLVRPLLTVHSSERRPQTGIMQDVRA